MLRSYSRRALPRLLLPVFFAAAAARAADFPPVTDAERALKNVPGEPGAAAVTLFRRGEFFMLDPAKQQASSQLTVRVRRKILNEKGKDQYGTVEVLHSGLVRLHSFVGRTILPDGRIVPLPPDARFKSVASTSLRLFKTSVAFPAVEVGAILDYSYQLNWDSFMYLEPLYFHDRIPVLHSEIVYHVPDSIQAGVWSRDPMNLGVKTEKTESAGGATLRAWLDNLGSIPEEPEGFPLADYSTQLMLIPTAFTGTYAYVALLKDWPNTCQMYEDEYRTFQRHDGGAGDRARELARAAGAAPRAQAEAIFRFVRDEIETAPSIGVGLARNRTAGALFAERRGESQEKALLLATMLDAAKIPVHLVWAAARSGGVVDLSIPNPAWFDRVLVVAEIDRQEVYLDPADSRLGFGHLSPDFEGVTALRFDRKKPAIVTLPAPAFSENIRQVNLDLHVRDDGHLEGTGTLHLGGQHAWTSMPVHPDPARAAAIWKTWIEKRMPDFEVATVKVEEAADAARIDVQWTLTAREEASLPSEASLLPSRPLGPIKSAALFPASGRRGGVLFPFGDRDEVDLSLCWPAGWSVAAIPKSTQQQTAVGSVAVTVALDDQARTIHYIRRIDIGQKEIQTKSAYAALSSLLTTAERSDAQLLALRSH